MALFKVCRGSKVNLPTARNDGWAYFCTDTGDFYIDWKDDAGTLQRTQISAAAATVLKYFDGSDYVELDGNAIAESVSTINTHVADKSNPHSVTKSQVGLGNVDNTSDANKPVSTAQATAIAEAKKAGTDAQSNLDSHTENVNNPHAVTKSQVGLGDVPNVATNDQTPTYSAASALATLVSGEKLSVSMGKIMKAITDLISHLSNKSNPHGVTAAQVGAVPTTRTVNGKALSGNITLSASDVGADASGSASAALGEANEYTDTKIANLINSAPTTLDTLGEIATAMEENADVVSALESAVGSKADASALTSHTGNTTAHITATERTNWNDANSKKHSHSNETVLDGITSALIAAWNAAKTHADSAHAPSNAEANQNAFSNVVVGSTTIAADTKTDTLTLVAGSNVTITPDATNDSVTISATDTKYTHPTTSGNKHIPSGGATGQILKWSEDGTAAWANESDTTYSVATTSANGLMSSSDKSKLNGMSSSAGAMFFSATQPSSWTTRDLWVEIIE